MIHRFSAKLGHTALALVIAREDRKPKVRLLNVGRSRLRALVEPERFEQRREDHAHE